MRVIVPALFVLAACVPPSANEAIAEQTLSSAWLVGYWTPENESCESDAGIRYDEDGSWFAYGATGTWRTGDAIIISTVTHRWTDGGDEEEAVSPPERHVERIEVLSRDMYRSRWEDGTVVTLRRCPSENGADAQ